MGRGLVFLPITFLRKKCISELEILSSRLTKAKNIALAKLAQKVLEQLEHTDPKTIEYLIDEMAEAGDRMYLAVLHLKRMLDSKYASKFFEKATVYTFEGTNWLNLWDHKPERKTRFVLGEYVKRIPQGQRLFILDVRQEHIDHIILQVMHDEDIGYISLNGDMALYPTKFFKRV